MEIGFNLNLQQTQKLILTQELKQSLNILHMNAYELEVEIINESQENPLMEVEKKDEIDWEKYLDSLSQTYNREKGATEYSRDEENTDFENMLTYKKNLYEHLKEQLCHVKISKEIKALSYYLIDSLDSDGYLKINLSDIAKNISKDILKLKKALKVVQSLEPYGVGARNLQECLIIQLKIMGYDEKELLEMIKNDLNSIASRKYKELAKKYKLKEEEVIDYCMLIRELNPKPANEYDSDQNSYVVPDVIIKKENEDFVVVLNEKNIPSIRVNNFYQSILSTSKDNDTKEYIKQKLNSAINLIKNIESRKKTILSVSEEILNEQMDFFVKGPKFLKTMTLKDIADKLNFHESTISRAVNGKYALTPFGLYELKYFFSSAPTDEELASNSIKNIIKEIVEQEKEEKPYSDQKICSILEEKGITISRRTVAKYRDELGILSSSKRKKIGL